MYQDVIMSGFGGQGIQIISQIAALAAIRKGLEITYLPSYGVEKRGGRTNVTMVISDSEIGSPITNHPMAIIALDIIALETFQPVVREGGVVIANTSLIPEELFTRQDVQLVRIRSNEEALAMGNAKVANMICLGAYLQRTAYMSFGDIESVIGDVIPERLKHTIPDNLKAIQKGMDLAR